MTKPTARSSSPLLVYFSAFAFMIIVAAVVLSSGSTGKPDAVFLQVHAPAKTAPQLAEFAGSCGTEYSCAAARNLTAFQGRLAASFSNAFRPFGKVGLLVLLLQVGWDDLAQSQANRMHPDGCGCSNICESLLS